MKLIPCPNCQKGAVGQATGAFPDGAPVVVGRFTCEREMVVKCFRCKKAFKVNAMAFHALPEMTADERKSLGGEE